MAAYGSGLLTQGSRPNRTRRKLKRQRHASPRYMTTTSTPPGFTRFAIGFDERDRGRLHELIDQMLDSGKWSEGALVERFEAAWSAWNGLPSVALSSWAGGALAALHFAGVASKTVLCPSNTFMATPLSAIRSG